MISGCALTYYPEIEIAESFLTSKDGKELLWDFTLECPKSLKMQIFTVLKEVIHTYKGRYRKEKLLALQRLYQFCMKHQVADIETMTLAKEQQFEQELSEHFRGEKKSAVFGILRMSRKILFLQAPEIHWNANVWFLERFHFSRERMNPSKPVEWVSFKEVTQPRKSKDFAKISAVPVWNHRFIYQYHPNQAAGTSYIPGTFQWRRKANL